MSLLNALVSPEAWRDYYEYKLGRAHLPEHERAALEAFVQNGAYLPLGARTASGGYCFAPPEKRLISKLGTDKKRVVYAFSYEESLMLKLIAFELYRYDGIHEDNCYSFRREKSARAAVTRLVHTPGIASMHCCKLDISDYFNSIDTGLLLEMLRGIFRDDALLYAFFEDMLTADCAVFEGRAVSEKRGAMAGTPVSPFLANVYLHALDAHFALNGLPYARYSDDIIFFAPDEETLLKERQCALALIEGLGLGINLKKAYTAPPGGTWEYLGVEYSGGMLDLSAATKAKLKGKLRRKARALRRWTVKKSAPPERAMAAYIRIFNRKFFELDAENGANDLTWARWFFPLVTTDAGLGEIDRYMQQCLRYIATGSHGKKNYRVGYPALKAVGYRSLVHEYHAYKKSIKKR